MKKLTTSETRQLLKKANEARKRAYASYSGYSVGAALLTHDRKIFQGCNVENASYGLTLCAERVAIVSAVAAGARRFKAIAIVADGPAVPRPCGACLQVMSEFCGPDFPVVLASAGKLKYNQVYLLKELLPQPFKLRNKPVIKRL